MFCISKCIDLVFYQNPELDYISLLYLQLVSQHIIIQAILALLHSQTGSNMVCCITIQINLNYPICEYMAVFDPNPILVESKTQLSWIICAHV